MADPITLHPLIDDHNVSLPLGRARALVDLLDNQLDGMAVAFNVLPYYYEQVEALVAAIRSNLAAVSAVLERAEKQEEAGAYDNPD